MYELYTILFSRALKEKKKKKLDHPPSSPEYKKSLRTPEWDPNKIEENQMDPKT